MSDAACCCTRASNSRKYSRTSANVVVESLLNSMSGSDPFRRATTSTPWRPSKLTGPSASAIVPAHTSVGCASLRHTPLLIVLARETKNTGTSSHSVPHDPPGSSAETCSAHSIGRGDDFVLAGAPAAAGFHSSPAASLMARPNAHRTVYVVSSRGHPPRSTRFQCPGDESSAAARCTMRTSNGPTAVFADGTAIAAAWQRTGALRTTAMVRSVALAARLILSIVTGKANGIDSSDKRHSDMRNVSYSSL